jgi:hydroxyacylglutathione hydrolase
MMIPLDAVRWIHGAADCDASTDPMLQVHRHSQNTYILRESKCYNYEGNFIYLLVGTERAILFDTGAGPQRAALNALPLLEVVDRLLDDWSAERGTGAPDLLVAHTHSHADHMFWDGQFAERPRTIVVGGDLDEVVAFYGLRNWPEGSAVLALGGRDLVVFPLPGHHPSHLAVYDPEDLLLLTGDTLYPGLLTIHDWTTFRRSAQRLADFVGAHRVELVLGNHIEMERAAGKLYPIGTTYQPNERALPLGPEHVRELHAACEAMGEEPRLDVHADFIIGGAG